MLRYAVLVCAIAAACAVPTQVHIAYAGGSATEDPDGMAVSWQTESKTKTSVVKYGLSPSSLTETVTGSCSTYLETYDHHVVLAGLKPDTVYFYQCGDETDGWSKVFNFRTAPVGSADGSASFLVYGDMGIYNSDGTRRVLQHVAPGVNFIWHVGDISYADDAFLHHPFTFTYEKTWNTFMNEIQNVSSVRPYMTCPGNHEAECHSGVCFVEEHKRKALANFTAYNHRFRMPSKESGGVLNMWYSFNYGPIHMINIDTETDYPGAPLDEYSSKNGGFGDQLAWLEEDLKKAAANRHQRPWIFVSGHRPVYSVASFHSDTGRPSGEAAKLQAAVEDLFVKYGVDVYFCGHEHSMDRSYPVYNTTQVQTNFDNPKYPVYVVVGSGGNTEGHTHFGNAVPQWSAARNNRDYGIGRVRLAASNGVGTFSWEFLRGQDGNIGDSFTLTKKLP